VKYTGHGLAVSGTGPRTALIEHHPPKKLEALLNLGVPVEGSGKEGLVEIVDKVLRYSVNTWDQGFMDKLYASTNAVSFISEKRSTGQDGLTSIRLVSYRNFSLLP